jgi:hypothetical protein
MKTRFKIDRIEQKDGVHLRLIGEFNDVSICELIETLKDGCNTRSKVFIHTGGLQSVSVSGFGRAVFERNLSELEDGSVQIHFTGSNANPLAPPRTYA